MGDNLRDLHYHIDAHVDGDQEWEYDHHVKIPPDYPVGSPDETAFVLHQADNASIMFQRKYFAYSRMEGAIRQYEARMRVIENIIRHAPRKLSQKGLGAAIVEVIHMDMETLYDRYGESSGLEH